MKWRFCRIDFHQVLASKLGGTTDSLGLIEVRPFCSRRGLLGQSATQIGGAWMENPNAVKQFSAGSGGCSTFCLRRNFGRQSRYFWSEFCRREPHSNSQSNCLTECRVCKSVLIGRRSGKKLQPAFQLAIDYAGQITAPAHSSYWRHMKTSWLQVPSSSQEDMTNRELTGTP